MSDDILFDNFVFTDDKKVADDWADQTWVIKHGQEQLGSASGVRGSYIHLLIDCSRVSCTVKYYALSLVSYPKSPELVSLRRGWRQ